MNILIRVLRTVGQFAVWTAGHVIPFCFGSLMRFAITATVVPALIGIYIPSSREMANAAMPPAILLLAVLIVRELAQRAKPKKRKRG